MKWRILQGSICLLISLVLLIYIFNFNLVRVQGESMLPTLHPTDNLLLLKTKKIERNNIVIFYNDSGSVLIKRVLALPGENILGKNGKIYINGIILEEKLKNTISDFEGITLSDNEYFVIGDNRSSSIDSRTFGPIRNDKIMGKVIARIFPNPRFNF